MVCAYLGVSPLETRKKWAPNKAHRLTGFGLCSSTGADLSLLCQQASFPPLPRHSLMWSTSHLRKPRRRTPGHSSRATLAGASEKVRYNSETPCQPETRDKRGLSQMKAFPQTPLTLRDGKKTISLLKHKQTKEQGVEMNQ